MSSEGGVVVTTLEEHFVEIVKRAVAGIKYQDWELVEILGRLVRRAGFGVDLIDVGDVWSGTHLRLNRESGLRVWMEAKPDGGRQVDEPATAWLDLVWQRVADDREGSDLVAVVRKAVELTQPLEPIRLCDTGGFLVEQELIAADFFSARGREWYAHLPNRLRDESPLEEGRIQHRYCGGMFKIRQVTEREQAFHCAECGLRRRVPLGIRIFGALREYCQQSYDHP